MQKILDKFWKEWYREIPLHNNTCALFGVNNGSTFEIKGLYILALILGVLWVMVTVPWAFWAYVVYTVGGILLIASGLAFIRTFINKASWSKDSEDGQD